MWLTTPQPILDVAGLSTHRWPGALHAAEHVGPEIVNSVIARIAESEAAGRQPPPIWCPWPLPPGWTVTGVAYAGDEHTGISERLFLETPDGLQQPVPVLPGPLRDIAEVTGGQAYEATSLPELGDVYEDIGSVVGFRDVDRDISGWFLGVGLVLLALAGAGSLAWSQRLP